MRVLAAALSVLLVLVISLPAPAARAAAVRTVVDLPASSPTGDSVTWSPDGQRLAYIGRQEQLMLLDLATPDGPRQINPGPARSPVFRPDGKALVYTGQGPLRRDEWRPETLYLQELDGGKALDLLPGDLAIQSVSTAKQTHRWFGGPELAYEEHMGTAVQQLFFLNVTTGKLVAQPELLATGFRWAPAGERVAGQWSGGPARFWIWDRQAGYLRQPSETVEVFEAWSPDGREVLYTEWQCRTPYCGEGASTLWRLDLATGRRQRVAQGAGLAAWSAAGQIAYIRLGERLELVVTDAGTNRTLWTEQLGRRPEQFEQRWELYRPKFEANYLAFRNARDEWLVSIAANKAVRRIDRGKEARLIWGPGGRHLAIHSGADRGRLLVLANPLSAETAPAAATASLSDKVAPPARDPPGHAARGDR